MTDPITVYKVHCFSSIYSHYELGKFTFEIRLYHFWCECVADRVGEKMWRGGRNWREARQLNLVKRRQSGEYERGKSGECFGALADRIGHRLAGQKCRRNSTQKVREIVFWWFGARIWRGAIAVFLNGSPAGGLISVKRRKWSNRLRH